MWIFWGVFAVPASPTLETHRGVVSHGPCQTWPSLTARTVRDDNFAPAPALRLRGGGKDAASDRFASTLGKSVAGLDFDAIDDEGEKQSGTAAALQAKEAGSQLSKKKLQKKKSAEPKTR